MTKVLLVLASSTGGTGRHVAALARELVGLGFPVTVAGPAATGAAFGLGDLGARFVAVEIGSGARPLRDARSVRALRRLAAGSDVVHAHGLRAGLLAGLATPRRVPYVVTWHNAVLVTGLRRVVTGMLAGYVARRGGVALCVSRDLVDAVRAYGGADVRLAPVAAPTLAAPSRPVAEVRAELGAEQQPLVLTVARLHPQKGLPLLIEAAARLSTRDTPPLVVVAGDGPQRAELGALIDRLAAPVRLLGARDDIPDLLAAADVVVQPSIWEGSPLAAQEALQAGRPLVATDVGGTGDIVGDGAVLIRPFAEALVDAVAALLDDPAERAALGGRALAAARALPGEADVAGLVVATYEQLLGDG